MTRASGPSGRTKTHTAATAAACSGLQACATMSSGLTWRDIVGKHATVIDASASSSA